jgi:hypothetical protein
MKRKQPKKRLDRVASLKRRLTALERRVRIMDEEVITRSKLRSAFNRAARCENESDLKYQSIDWDDFVERYK